MSTASIRKLGWFLCWAVVFADIGTSVYYTPGILYGQVGNVAGFFVSLTGIVFLLLVIKYVEITSRYPEGGGVVTVATEAFGPWFGALGGILIIVDYFLTASISSVSGFYYLSSVLSVHVSSYIVLAAVLGLFLLGCLNVIGIKESALVTAFVAVTAAIVDVIAVVVTLLHISPQGWIALAESAKHALSLSPQHVIIGFAGSFLAFSGLESISQISPAIAKPRKKIAQISMFLVVVTVMLTAPFLTLFSTTILTKQTPGTHETVLQTISQVTQRQQELATTANAHKRIVLSEEISQAQLYSGELISELGEQVGGELLKIAVVLSASALLLFAANTAIIGSYHVFVVLSQKKFLPELLQSHNAVFRTPHWSITVAVIIPIVIVIMTNGNMDLLGSLYAFGLLGAFCLSSIGLDVVRYREGQRWNWIFWLGIGTSIAVIIAWITNIYAKPSATEFGGGLTICGMLLAYFLHKNLSHEEIAHVISLSRLTKIRPNQLLFPVEDAPSVSALEFIATEAKRLHRSVTLVFVRDFPDILQSAPQTFLVDKQAKKTLLDLVRFFRNYGIPTDVLYNAQVGELDTRITYYQKRLKPLFTFVASGKHDRGIFGVPRHMVGVFLNTQKPHAIIH